MLSAQWFILLAATVLAAFAGSSLAEMKSASARHVLGVRSVAPAGWRVDHRADSLAAVNFFIALKQCNLDVLESKFWSVSNPKSVDYRNFLSIEEINRIIAPPPALLSTVRNWLLENGVVESEISTFVDALEIKTSVSVAERLFETEMYAFSHYASRRIVLRQSGSFSVPAHIRPLIDMVIGIANFPHDRPNFKKMSISQTHTHDSASGSASKPHRDSNSATLSSSPGAPTDIGYSFIGQSISDLYNIPPQKQQNASSITSQGVVIFYSEPFLNTDLVGFGELVDIPLTPLTPDHVIGNVASGSENSGTVDLELIASVNIEATNWYWGNADEVYLYGWTTQFYNTTDVPQVVSISYYYWEGDQCSVQYFGVFECLALGLNSAEYVSRVNTDFQKLALRGITVIVSSGSFGAHTYTDQQCRAPTLRVDFPSSSPYITSVGATEVINPTPLPNPPELCQRAGDNFCISKGTEVAPQLNVSMYMSGGGFSQLFPMPAYQNTAVKAYLDSGVTLPPPSMYNTSNRAHPDVASLGGVAILWQEGLLIEGIRGTEIATPVFAAIAALLNQASIAKSGKPLGFLNPLLYQIAADNPSAYNDITVGNNFCSQAGEACDERCNGYYAAKGWDPVTGLGTPNYQVLLQEVMKLAGNAEVLL